MQVTVTLSMVLLLFSLWNVCSNCSYECPQQTLHGWQWELIGGECPQTIHMQSVYTTPKNQRDLGWPAGPAEPSASMPQLLDERQRWAAEPGFWQHHLPLVTTYTYIMWNMKGSVTLKIHREILIQVWFNINKQVSPKLGDQSAART